MTPSILKTTKQQLGRVWGYAMAHKVISGIALVALLGAGWWGVSAATGGKAETRYVLGAVTRGTIVASVSASGQVSSSRSLDIKPEVSGAITYIAVKPGAQVKKGQLIASLDSQDAQKSLRDAQNNLKTAQLALEKLQKPASGLTLAQAQNAVSNAQDSLAKTYVSSQGDVSNTFLDMPGIMAHLQDIIIGTTASHGSQWNIDYYLNATAQYDDKARAYRDDAYNAYVAAKAAYDKAFADYKAMGTSPDTATVEAMTSETNDMVKAVSDALKNTNAFIQLYSNSLTNHNLTPSTVATAALSTLSTDIQNINGKLSSLVSDVASIKSSKQSLTEKQLSLQDVTDGADPLDVRSDELAVEQKQDAVTDAYATLAKYSVRAPFDGTISAVNQYAGDAGGSATLATLVTPQQIARLSLNEVDAAKVKVGQKATLTFDAIDGLTLTGTVAQVDVAGTVSQGVVSYSVDIAFDTQDERIKPGMTVNAAIQTATKQDVIIVPSSAVKTSNGVSYVQIFNPALPETTGSTGVTSPTLPQIVEVTTGLSDDTNIEIVSGLSEGQQIVTRTTTGTTQTTSSARAGTGASGVRTGNAGFSGPSGGTVIRSF